MNKIAMMQLVKRELTNFKSTEPYQTGPCGDDKKAAISMNDMLTNIANELRRQSDEITFIRETAVKFILLALEDEQNRAAEREQREDAEKKEKQAYEEERAKERAKQAKRAEIENWKPDVGDKIKIVKATTKDQEKGPFKVGSIVTVTAIDFNRYVPIIELSLGDVKTNEDHDSLQRKLEWGVIELVKES